MTCYSSSQKKLASIQIKAGNPIQQNELNTASDNTEMKLVWDSEDRFIFEDSLNEKIVLFLMKKNGESIELLRTIQSVEAYEIVSKSKNDYDFHLVYAKYKENKVNLRLKNLLILKLNFLFK